MYANTGQKIERLGLLDLLSNINGGQFVIPVFQRNYTWTTNEVKQLFRDLESVLSNEYSNHFLGTIIYTDRSISFSERQFTVIDGQQRLTTVFLILYAIKALMKENNDIEKIKELEENYLINKNNSNNESKYRLKPYVSDDDVFKEIVEDRVDKIEDKQSNVYKNYINILSYIRKLNADYSLDEIIEGLNKLNIVCIPLYPDDSAQRIFESINSTGVKLTASDLIRNFLLMDLNNNQHEEYFNKYWMEIEKNISSDPKKLESFFRVYLGIKNKKLPAKRSIYNEFKRWYYQNNEISLKEIFKDIIKYSNYYNEIYHTEINKIDKALRETIKEYRIIGSELPAPLIMGFYNLYQNDEINKEQLSELISIVNNYLVRRSICDLDTKSITKLFAPLLSDVIDYCREDYNLIVESLIHNLIVRNKNDSMFVPDEVQLYDMVLNSNVYKNKNVLRIFLDKLEHDQNPAPVDLDKLNIEHVMPQNPRNEWYDILNVDQETYERNVNRLGNLTLASISDNSRMQNRLWDYKNKILATTSHLKINKEILEIDQWTIEEIDKKTKNLINEINRLFPYPKIENKDKRVEKIYMDRNGIKAYAYFYIDTKDVEILEGTELYEFKNYLNYPLIEETRNELIEDGIIAVEGNKMIFKKSYLVKSQSKNHTALSSAASLILHGSRNGWDSWKNLDGKF